MTARDLRPFQYSLRGLMAVGLYFVVLGKVCSLVYAIVHPTAPVWRLVFLFTWTAVILAHLASSIWGWFWLDRQFGADLAGHRKSQRAVRASFAWGLIPLILLLSSLRRPTDEALLRVQWIAELHLVPLVLVTHLPYVFGSRAKGAAPVRCMRLFSLLGYVLPAVSGAVMLIAWRLF